MKTFFSIIITIICPLSVAYRDGARMESCYDHNVIHFNPDLPPTSKQDCIRFCRYDLTPTGRYSQTDEYTFELLESNVTEFECDEIYGCKY